ARQPTPPPTMPTRCRCEEPLTRPLSPPGTGPRCLASLRDGLRGRQDGLDLEVDADGLAHQDPARLERLVPGDPELLAIDLRGGREGDPALAPQVRRRIAVVLGLQRDRSGQLLAGGVADD